MTGFRRRNSILALTVLVNVGSHTPFPSSASGLGNACTVRKPLCVFVEMIIIRCKEIVNNKMLSAIRKICKIFVANDKMRRCCCTFERSVVY